MARPTKPPRIPRARELIWQSLRIMRKATTAALVTISERPKKSVQRELRDFVRTGYVRVENPEAGYRERVHHLIRDTGHKPPLFLMKGKAAIGAVDRNTGEVFGINGGDPPQLKRVANWMHKRRLTPGKAAR